MAHWSEPLVAFLAAQPPTTLAVTLTLTELEALAGQPLPAGAAARTYWWSAGSVARRRLAAIGWRLASVGGWPPTLTFARLSEGEGFADASA